MRQTPRSAAIYSRISLDRNGDSLAPERQEADARDLCERRGWSVVEYYGDRDTSAYKRNIRRPEYDRMIRDLRNGKVDAIVVWKLDRLVRRFTAIGKVLDVLEETGAELVSVTEPFIDTTSPIGKGVLGLMASMAEQESKNISMRVKRANQQAAENGKMHGGGSRQFGLTRDGKIVPDEANVIRDAMGRVLTGESLRSIAYELNDRGVVTSTGKRWRSVTLGQMLRSPRLAALRHHEGELVPGTWDAIVTKDEHLALVTALAKSPGDRKEASRVHLLSGIIRCSECGQTMRHLWFNMKNGRKFERYQCAKHPGHDNCGHVAITSKSVDGYVSERLFSFMAEIRVKPLSGGSDEYELVGQLEADHAARRALVQARFVEQSLSQDDFKPAKAALDERIAAAERRLDVLRQQHQTEFLLPPIELEPWQDQSETPAQQAAVKRDRETLAAWWADATPAQRQVVARQWIESVTISPAKRRGGNVFDPDRVSITFASPVV